MAQLNQRQVVILGGVGLLVFAVLVLIFANLRSSTLPPELTLRVWGTIDPGVFQELEDAYEKTRTNVGVEYTFLPPQGYEEAVVAALAAGEGPDVFMIPSGSLLRNRNKIYPAPAAQFSVARLREQFPAVVEGDFVADGKVYALPLYIDTLALIYNRRLLDKASVVRPPQTWEELQRLVPHLRVLDSKGQIVQAAAALGASAKSVPHAPDILLNLMFQYGLFSSPGSYKTFDSPAGVAAMNSYLQFANSAAGEYTWNELQPDAYESFGAAKVAMVFGYRADVLDLKRKYPLLEIAVAPMPSLGDGSLAYSNVADYWGVTVSRQSKFPEWGWDFVIYMAANPQNAAEYVRASGLPPALRSLIGTYLGDAELGVFAKQALNAGSFSPPDERRVKSILNEAIAAVVTGRLNSYQALQQAQSKINLLLER